jgi:hypothetical protein
MGSFNWVNVEVTCPKCGHSVKNFQSKDFDCDFSTVDPQQVSNLYASCPNCNYWIEFTRVVPYKPIRSIPYNESELLDMGFNYYNSGKN